MTVAATKETYSFQTEVGRLLDIVAGSLYSNREIFLRELISNASDACDKLRHMALTAPSLIEGNSDFKIELKLDSKAKTVTVSDNGIGMSHDDLLDTLGTIAKSGTGAFLEQLSQDSRKDLGLIGQFGVGFYSAYMVAARVDVLTRKAGEAEAWLWSSDGKGQFTIEPASRAERGTTVTLSLKEDAGEFLENVRIRHVVKTYSDHIGFPVILDGEALNAASALWTRPTKDITAEQHKEFYCHISHAFDEPWLVIHNRVEGVVSYTNLLYVPSVRPFDMFDAERKGHVKLYVNRVFIAEDAKGLLPPWLRFLRGVVDSPDLSLNISREMLQTDPRLAKIRADLTKRVLGELLKKSDRSTEDYAAFWKNFGVVLKEGLIDDAAGSREQLLRVCRFSSTNDEKVSGLSDYVSRIKVGQKVIYYITGEDAAKLAHSPQIEGFRAKGVEVLLLSDPVDEFWIPRVGEFEGKPFQSVTRGAPDLDAVSGEKSGEDKNEDKDRDKANSAAIDALIGLIKLELGQSVKDVRLSKRLTESPVCLVADEGDMDVNMERLLRRHGQLSDRVPRILEINPKHDTIRKLGSRAQSADAARDTLLKDAAHLLLDQARISDGEPPSDPAAFARRLSAVLGKAL